MKKTVAIVMALILTIFAFSSCSKSGKTDNSDATGKALAVPEGSTFNVEILTFSEANGLKGVGEKIGESLKDICHKEGITVKYNFRNAGGDESALKKDVDEIAVSKPDMIIAVGVTAAAAIKEKSQNMDIPLVFCGVSDASAAGLVYTEEKTGNKVTGIDGYPDAGVMVKSLSEKYSDTMYIGGVYDGESEAASDTYKAATSYINNSNPVVIIEGSEKDSLASAVDRLINVITASYAKVALSPAGTDSAFSVSKTIKAAGIAYFETAAYEDDSAAVSFSSDNSKLISETASIAADILIYGFDSSETSVKTIKEGTITINTDVCKNLGMDVDMLKEAYTPYCETVK